MAIAEYPLGKSQKVMGASEFLALPEEMRCELVKGELIEVNPPSPRHALVATNLVFHLYQWASSRNCGFAAAHETAIQTTVGPDTVRGLDAFYISFARLGSEALPEGPLLPVPELCIEVRSPSNRWMDLLEKAIEYLKAGAEEVWLVDPTPAPEDRFIESYRADRDPVRFGLNDEIVSPSLPEFRAVVKDAFRGI